MGSLVHELQRWLRDRRVRVLTVVRSLKPARRGGRAYTPQQVRMVAGGASEREGAVYRHLSWRLSDGAEPVGEGGAALSRQVVARGVSERSRSNVPSREFDRDYA